MVFIKQCQLRWSVCAFLSLATVTGIEAEEKKERILASIDDRAPQYEEMALKIWQWAEVGYQETQSTALLQEQLRQAGFEIESGVAAIPTAFVATYGQGQPVIGILAEFDALPGLSQEVAVERQVRVVDGAGHACGHHLLGVGSTAAAIALKQWLEETGHGGTVRLYGTPAEEGGSGKVYMVRAGLFDDVDVVLNWHPKDYNDASPLSSTAIKTAKFRFYGKASHAANAPEHGRSALDGVEAMNDMVNLLREHVPEATRIHYVITQGGTAPNVVPEFAEVFYYVRHPDAPMVEKIWQRVTATAEGAALGTGTRMDYEVISGDYNILPNENLAKVMDRNLRRVGGVQYTEAEEHFALQLRETLGETKFAMGSQEVIQAFEAKAVRGSSDVGDISWLVPTTTLLAATWVPGAGTHSWQAVASGGMSIGMKGMMVAAKTLALTAVDLYEHPATIKEAWRELEQKRGKDYIYHPLLGDREPPLDYRR